MAARMWENNKNGASDASVWSSRESGLIEPVTLTPMVRTKQAILLTHFLFAVLFFRYIFI